MLPQDIIGIIVLVLMAIVVSVVYYFVIRGRQT